MENCSFPFVIKTSEGLPPLAMHLWGIRNSMLVVVAVTSLNGGGRYLSRTSINARGYGVLDSWTHRTTLGKQVDNGWPVSGGQVQGRQVRRCSSCATENSWSMSVRKICNVNELLWMFECQSCTADGCTQRQQGEHQSYCRCPWRWMILPHLL